MFIQRSSVVLVVLAANSLAEAPAHAAYHITAKITVGGEGGWDYLEPDSIARRLYVSHEDRVVVIDMDALKVVGNVPDAPGMGGVALAPDLDRGFTANGDEDAVGVFELSSLKPVTKWKSTGKRPNQIAYEPATKRVFSFNSTGRNVTVFDAISGAVLGTIEVDGRTEFYAMDGKGMIYDSLQDKATVIAIDARTLNVVATYSLAPHAQPAGTVMDPVTRRIFVACRSKSLLVLDADNGTILSTFPIGERNDAAKFDPGLGRVYIACSSGAISVIQEDDPDHFRKLEDFPVQKRVHSLAVDIETHRVYAPEQEENGTPVARMIVYEALPTPKAAPAK